MERRDPYRILQVQPDADPDVMQAAYRVLARKAHPDAGHPWTSTPNAAWSTSTGRTPWSGIPSGDRPGNPIDDALPHPRRPRTPPMAHREGRWGRMVTPSGWTSGATRAGHWARSPVGILTTSTGCVGTHRALAIGTPSTSCFASTAHSVDRLPERTDGPFPDGQGRMYGPRARAGVAHSLGHRSGAPTHPALSGARSAPRVAAQESH